MSNPNQELLDWAVKNIKEWNDRFTHLRGGSSSISVFFSNGEWRIDGDVWCGYTGNADYLGIKRRVDVSFTSTQVITKQEWEQAKNKSVWFGKQVYVSTIEESHLVQQAIFDVGGIWRLNSQVGNDIRDWATDRYLNISDKGVITWQPNRDETLPEIKFKVVKSIEITETIPVSVKTQSEIEYDKLQEQISSLQDEHNKRIEALKLQAEKLKG
jgi:hypothetical protein